MPFAPCTVMSLPVSHYMTSQPFTIGRRASLAKAHRIMREHDIRHLPVLEGGQLVGVVSRGDLHLLESLASVPLDAVDVEEAMTPMPYAVSGKTPMHEVVDIMVQHKYGCAVIVDAAGMVEGIFTTVDAMQALVNLLRSDDDDTQGVREITDRDNRPTLRFSRSP